MSKDHQGWLSRLVDGPQPGRSPESKRQESSSGLWGRNNIPIVPLTRREQRNLTKLNKALPGNKRHTVGLDDHGRPVAINLHGNYRREIPLDGGPGFERALIDYNDGLGPR